MSLGAMIAKTRTDARLTVDELAKLTNIPTTLLNQKKFLIQDFIEKQKKS